MPGKNLAVLLFTHESAESALDVLLNFLAQNLTVHVLDSSPLPDVKLNELSDSYTHLPGASLFEKIKLLNFTMISEDFITICSDDEFKMIPDKVCMSGNFICLSIKDEGFINTYSVLYDEKWDGYPNRSYNPGLIYGIHEKRRLEECVKRFQYVSSEFFAYQEIIFASILFWVSFRRSAVTHNDSLWLRNQFVPARVNSLPSFKIPSESDYGSILKDIQRVFDGIEVMDSEKFASDLSDFYKHQVDVSVQKKIKSSSSIFTELRVLLASIVRDFIFIFGLSDKIRRVTGVGLIVAILKKESLRKIDRGWINASILKYKKW